MSTFDAMLAAATVASHAHTTGDLLINAGLYYGPGILLAATVTATWRGIRWAHGQYHDRLDRRHYAALAFRLNRVADRADAYLAMPADLVNARLEAQYAAPHHVTEGEK